MGKLCSAKTRDSVGFLTFLCGNQAKYGEYCGVHSPERQAERAIEKHCARSERRRVVIAAARAVVDANPLTTEIKDLREAFLHYDGMM